MPRRHDALGSIQQPRTPRKAEPCAAYPAPEPRDAGPAHATGEAAEPRDVRVLGEDRRRGRALTLDADRAAAVRRGVLERSADRGGVAAEATGTAAGETAYRESAAGTARSGKRLATGARGRPRQTASRRCAREPGAC